MQTKGEGVQIACKFAYVINGRQLNVNDCVSDCRDILLSDVLCILLL